MKNIKTENDVNENESSISIVVNKYTYPRCFTPRINSFQRV